MLSLSSFGTILKLLIKLVFYLLLILPTKIIETHDSTEILSFLIKRFSIPIYRSSFSLALCFGKINAASAADIKSLSFPCIPVIWYYSARFH